MGKMSRLPDWDKRLQKYLTKSKKKKFAWGQFDCALFAMDGVKEMTGIDYASTWRNEYSNETGAFRQLSKHGVNSVHEWLDRTLSRSNVDFAKKGDVVCKHQNRFGAFGICLGEKSAFVSDVGWTEKNTKSCDYFWRID